MTGTYCVLATRGGWGAVMKLVASSIAGPSYSVTWSSQPADGDYQVLVRVADRAPQAAREAFGGGGTADRAGRERRVEPRQG